MLLAIAGILLVL